MTAQFTATAQATTDQFAAGLRETAAQYPTFEDLPTEPAPAVGERVTVTAVYTPDRDDDFEGLEPFDAVLIEDVSETCSQRPYRVRRDDGQEQDVHRVRVTGERWLTYRAERAEKLAALHAGARDALAQELYRLRVMRQDVQGVLIGALPAEVREQLETALSKADRI